MLKILKNNISKCSTPEVSEITGCHNSIQTNIHSNLSQSELSYREFESSIEKEGSSLINYSSNSSQRQIPQKKISNSETLNIKEPEISLHHIESLNKSNERYFPQSTTSTPVRDKSRSITSQNTTNSSINSSNEKFRSNEKYYQRKSPLAPICLGDFITLSPKHQKKSPKDSPKQRPRRRVVPTLIGEATNKFTSPAFRNENNILSVGKDEVIKCSQLTLSQEHEDLKKQKKIIAKELENSKPIEQNLQIIRQENYDISSKDFDLNKITNKRILDKLINIYSSLIELNLTTNILHEFSFVFNLLNVKPLNNNKNDYSLINDKSDYLSFIFRNYNNCLYFASSILEEQKHFLALFDLTTLKVFIDFERLKICKSDLKGFLNDVYVHKLQLDSLKSSSKIYNTPFTNVFYQQENDARHNFPSDKEFLGFKKQRDMFYDILKLWEINHLDPNWNFQRDLSNKVSFLINFMENPINMAHLARLYTLQLISTIYSDTPADFDIKLPNLDVNKLNKLHQRLITPSHFSSNYQFPGNQAFFRDFLIAASKSIIFVEQLKILLAAELMELNNSNYDIINISGSLEDKFNYTEYVVSTEAMLTMLVLAKFLGLIISCPFSYDAMRTSSVDNRQIELRNKVQPTIDILAILIASINERKLIITVPWVVQYLSMFDYVTLRLTYYQRLMQTLYELYTRLTFIDAPQIRMRPTSVFILRTCLGWIFDHPNVPDDYYKYRQNREFIYSELLIGSGCDIQIFLPKALNNDFIVQEKLYIKEIIQKGDEITCTLAKIQNLHRLKDNPIKQKMANFHKSFDPLLENIVSVACPFLADFRLSMKPNKMEKTVSRTGRYRHITTISQTPTVNCQNDSQIRLQETFLQSQSPSVKRIVEFVIERITSAVVKDYQMEILLPSKNEAMEEIKKIVSLELDEVFNTIKDLYNKAEQLSMEKWNSELPKMIEERTRKALNALLPNEILPAIKNTCATIVIQKCKTKTEEWRKNNLKGMEFYTKNLKADAQRIVKRNSENKINVSTVLDIDLNIIVPSKVFKQLQYLLYYSLFHPNLIQRNEIENFCDDMSICLNKQCLPSSFYKVSGSMTVNLVQNLIEKEFLLTKETIEKFINIWLCKGMQEFIKINEKQPDENSSELSDFSSDTNIFSSLITKMYIRSLNTNHICYESYTNLLVHIINAKILNIDYINNRFVALFKEDWPQDILKELSFVLDNIKKRALNANVTESEKSYLFMEMLYDFARDIDEF